VKKGITLEPLIHGGKQESKLRAGTENVPAIVGLGKAAELARYQLQDAKKMTALRDRLQAGISTIVPEAQLNGHQQCRLPNTLNMTFPGIRGESLVIALDQHGIAISSGSACKSGSPEPTHVLTAMGKSPEEAHCALRFSLSHQTSEEDIDAVITELAKVLDEMKNTIRFLSCK
jgi:cysteine sulfinate desulfinase/cysteine desulfurase-like protein